LENVLNYNNPDIVWANPDRSNIYIKIEKKTPQYKKKLEKYDDLIMPVANELKKRLTNFPLTIMLNTRSIQAHSKGNCSQS
jgi:superfamily II DNA helicase RecQ